MTLADQCDELLSIVEEIPADRLCAHPTELLQAIITNLSPRGFASSAAFPYVYSYLKQGVPSVEQLSRLMALSKENQEGFLPWARRMSNSYYPVLGILERHKDRFVELSYRNIGHRVRELAENIVHTVDNPVVFYSSKRPPLMPEQDEIIITLACAQFCHEGVFHHSPLLTPDFLAGAHWSRVIKPDLADWLLSPDIDREAIIRLLSTETFRVPEQLLLRLENASPTLIHGVL